MNRHLLLAATALALSACTATETAQAPAAAPPPPAAPAEDQTVAINAFFDAYDQAQLAKSPMGQSYRGIKTDYDKWDDFSDAEAVRENEAGIAALAEMRAKFASANLSPQARLSYRLFEKDVERAVKGFPYRNLNYVFDQMNGAQSGLPAFLINIHRVESKSDAEAYVKRLHGLGPALDQIMAEASAADAVLPPKWVFPYVISDSRNIIKGAPFDSGADSTLFADLKSKVAKLDIPQAEKDALVADGRQALLTSVKPAYERLIALMQAQEKRAGTDDGVWRFAKGGDYYAERLGYYTTTAMTPDQVHDLGLANVARIHEEMRGIMKQVSFKGDLPAFFAHMRTSKQFYFPNNAEGKAAYLAETNKAIDAMYKKLPEYFDTLPQARLTVKAVEPFREKSAGKAFYQRPAPDGSRPGTYYVNLYNMADMPSTEVEALAYHEGVPGHHLQRTIQTELKDVPPFRRFGGFTAYSEGWGLYTEKLGKDMGFYTDPYRDFGRLQLELHRAIRLVVDTGLHHKKWTREQAIKYVEDNSADAPGGIVKAIERYIVNPGQATAYLVGRLKISELRDRAQAQMGSRFTMGGFHDTVLLPGPVPLDILEENVDAWIKGN
ncbi:DUF885 domain-containing protein [Sphingoaurantiacus capsulatus]|uniref:DUF885 domain-containing protein n=1 Tax=Sphingoaurantiacus capsulatus TaxID=1771310 RepID=A0ABV7X8J9_9SPHN